MTYLHGGDALRWSWRADYDDFHDGLPHVVRLVSADERRFKLELKLSQLEPNVQLKPEVFRVDVPPNAERISVEELKRSGLLGAPRAVISRPLARVRAFAKINRSLEVLGVRPDGFHELRTVFQSIALHDTLAIRAVPGVFQLTCDDPACPADRSNLIWRAAEQVWKAAGRRGVPRDVSIQLTKRIPLQAGLGGGSSDAAAALRAFGRLWRVKPDRVRAIGSSLGADVPYFFEGGTALGLDRGDLLFPLVDAPRAWVVLVIPSFGVSPRMRSRGGIVM